MDWSGSHGILIRCALIKTVSGSRKSGGKLGSTKLNSSCPLQDCTEAGYAVVPWEFPKGVLIVFQTSVFQSSSSNISGVLFFRAVREMPGWMSLALSFRVLGNWSLPAAPWGLVLGGGERRPREVTCLVAGLELEPSSLDLPPAGRLSCLHY